MNSSAVDYLKNGSGCKNFEKMGEILEIDDPYHIAKHLDVLVNDDLRAIRVRNWRSGNECEHDVKIMQSCFDGVYAQEPTLMKGGPTVYDFEGQEVKAIEYFKSAKLWNSMLREHGRPFVTSADRLSAIMMETHFPGVIPEQLMHGMTPSMQVIRKFEKGARAGPHVDRTDWDWPENITASTQVALIFCLCYHQVAECGGEVVLYGNIIDRSTWLKARLSGSAYEIRREFLSKNPLRIKPLRGDLLLFNAHLVHEVTEVLSGTRITSSNFFAWRGKDQPLG